MANETVALIPQECQIILQMIENSQFTINGTSIEPLYVLMQKLRSVLPPAKPQEQANKATPFPPQS